MIKGPLTINRNVMPNILRIFLCIIIILAGAVCIVEANEIHILDLRVESVVNPMGIDTEQPRFSWNIKGRDGHLSQSAYRIQVFSSLSKLRAEDTDIWDF